jgi:enoyl-CoA hydratase
MQSSPREPTSPGSSLRMAPLLTISQVTALCTTPWGLEGYSPLLEHNYLLLDAAGVDHQSDLVQRGRVIERLRVLPCPVIAVGASVSPALLGGVDVVVGNLQEAQPLLRNIDEHPLAAMTLVQLLRHNEETTPVQGLLAESLAYASLQGSADTRRALSEKTGQTVSAWKSGEAILIERREDELHLTLNRPGERNAYSVVMRDALYEALQLLKTDGRLRRAVIRGEGSCFSIGGDLNEFGAAPDPSTAHAIRSSRSVGMLMLELASQLEFRLHRACIGAGIELAAFGGRIIADPSTFVQIPEIKLGLLPGAGGTVSIMARIGRHRTAYLALSARRINAEKALQWGLIDEISDAEPIHAGKEIKERR